MFAPLPSCPSNFSANCYCFGIMGPGHTERLSLLRRFTSPNFSTIFIYLHGLQISTWSPIFATISNFRHRSPIFATGLQFLPWSPIFATVSIFLHCLQFSPQSPIFTAVLHFRHGSRMLSVLSNFSPSLSAHHSPIFKDFILLTNMNKVQININCSAGYNSPIHCSW